MNGSLSQFKATLQRKRERTEAKNKRTFNYKKHASPVQKHETDFNFPEFSESELEEFKARLKAKKKIRNVIEGILFLIVMAAMTIILFYISG